MEPIRPPRGQLRGYPRAVANQPYNSSLFTQEIKRNIPVTQSFTRITGKKIVVCPNVLRPYKQDPMVGVQQITESQAILGAVDAVPLGRGAVRARRQIVMEHFRPPRPQSSLGEIGKQVPVNDGKANTFLTNIEKMVCTTNPALFLCVIPSARGDLYSMIKRKLCLDRAVPSQIVLLKTVQKNNMSICTKIAIQINCKLGGAPWHVNIPKKGMMIVGYDVCHDSQRKNISFGALVATLNDTHTTNYFSCIEQHESGEELSVHFGTGISKALIKYKTKNGILPSSIVVYRDGVGEGQISHVHKTEVKLLQATCEQLYGTNKFCPISFCHSYKTYQCKIFCFYGPENPQAGTVIDTVVTDPTKYDLFLVSQHVTQGTVTPTHYQVIEDTLRLPPDIMQRLTYKLTHMYYNWSGTVRVPASCLFAHKLAFLTGLSLRHSPNPGLNELLYFL